MADRSGRKKPPQTNRQIVRIHIMLLAVSRPHSITTTRPGPDLLLAGPLFRKKCGGPYYMTPPDCLHPTRTVVIIDILLRTRAAMHTTIAAARHAKSFPLFPNHYFNISGLLPCCKKWKKNYGAFVGPLCVEAPVRPNMLNMPKFASGHDTTCLRHDMSR